MLSHLFTEDRGAVVESRDGYQACRNQSLRKRGIGARAQVQNYLGRGRSSG